MAKSVDRDLFSTLRAKGLRKSTAKRLSSPRQLATKTGSDLIGGLRSLVEELEDRARGGPAKRKATAKKAAATRRRKAAARSAAAKRGAKTRAKAKK